MRLWPVGRPPALSTPTRPGTTAAPARLTTLPRCRPSIVPRAAAPTPSSQAERFVAELAAAGGEDASLSGQLGLLVQQVQENIVSMHGHLLLLSHSAPPPVDVAG
jgi:hypothetical protein